MGIVAVGIDLAKSIFAVHGAEAASKSALVRPESLAMELFGRFLSLPARRYNCLMLEPSRHKIPVSTLIVVYTPKLEVLLIERADRPGYWQSVTGSQEPGETLRQTAIREVREEIGIDATRYSLTDWQMQSVYEIYPIWRHRYAPGITYNTEHVFSLLVPDRVPVTLNPREHLRYVWLPYRQAARRCFSASNRQAILTLVTKDKAT